MYVLLAIIDRQSIVIFITHTFLTVKFHSKRYVDTFDVDSSTYGPFHL